MERILCLMIGYGFGCILTAEIVSRICAGKPCREIGTGNPGMANIMTELGFWPGAAVLAGDVGKTLAAGVCSGLLFPALPFSLAAMYAGLGAVIGHDFPFWQHFHGGKGVAVTCMALAMAAPVWGLAADAAGMLVVFATGWLPLGAVVIPAVFAAEAVFLLGPEPAAAALAMLLLMLFCHRHGLARMCAGTERRRARLFRRAKQTKSNKTTDENKKP